MTVTTIPWPPGGRPVDDVVRLRASALTQDELVELYVAHRLQLTRIAVLLVDDMASAEDVVQDAFVGFLARGARLRDHDAALGYLRRSVVNGARSALRRRRTARAYVAPHDAGPDGPDAVAVLNEEHREVIAALDTLAPRQREVLVLRYWSQLSEVEISDTLGISRGAVKSTASRAMDALERALAAQGAADAETSRGKSGRRGGRR